MKRFFAVVLMLAMSLSLVVIPAHASGFSNANILDGGSKVRGEFKGSHGGSNDSYYSLTQSGTGANRVITTTMKKTWKRQYALMESGIANPLSGTDYDNVHFAHARIKIAVKKVNNEKVVLRLFPVLSDWTKEGDSSKDKSIFNLVYSNEYSTYGWMATNGKDSNGYPYGVTEHDQCHIYTSSDPTNTTTKSYEGRNFLTWGNNDTPIYQTFDFIFDCKKGYVYGYINGRLIATKINAPYFSNFYGYTICASGDDNSFVNGTKVWFKYDEERPGETLYVDTDDYTVRLEDVLVDAGLASNNGDPHQIMESDHIADYIFAGDPDYNYYDTYERRDSDGNPVSITAEKVKTGSGNVAQLYGGFYFKGKDWPGYAKGKGVIHVSFDQKINKKLNKGTNVNSSSYSFKVLSESNKSYELFSLAPTATNKMQITLEKQQGSENPQFVLDKDFNDTIHYDIILYGKHYTTSPETEKAEAMGYYFADGNYLGSYTINRGSSSDIPGADIWWTPTQLLLYSNNTANVTYSNYKIAVYDENKNAEDLVLEVDGSKLGWSNTKLTLSNEKSFTLSSKLIGSVNNVPDSSKAHIGIFSADNRLLDYDGFGTSSSITSKEFQLNYNGVLASYAKLFLWNGMEPIAEEEKILLDVDPLTYFMKVSYNNGMSWNKLDYRADHEEITEYNYPVENREILPGTIRVFDNIYLGTNGESAGSLINIDDSVFDTVTLTKGTDSLGYAFLAAKPEIYTHAKKLPNGYTPTYAAGYTRVVYTDDEEVTLTIPDNAKYLYLYDHGINEDTKEYEDCAPSSVLFSKSGIDNTRDPNTLRIATWNIGHFCLGSYTDNRIEELGFTAKEYKDHIYNAINADVLSLNEYSPMFTSSVAAKNAIFNEYSTKFEGEQNNYTCNAIFAKENLISNIEPHYFKCYSDVDGFKTTDNDFPEDHYYVTADLNVNGETVKLVNVHLLYTDNPQDLAIEALNELIDIFSEYDKIILMGDWNITYDKFSILKDAGYSIANTDNKLATYGPCQGTEKYHVDTADGYGLYDNIVYKGVNVSNFGLGGSKLSDHYTLYCDITVD